MDWLIPWIGAALAVSLLFWRTNKTPDDADRPPPKFGSMSAALLGAAAFAVAGYLLGDRLGGFHWAFLGIASGIAAATVHGLIVAFCDDSVSLAATFSVGAAVMGWLSPLAVGKGETQSVLFASVVGAGAAALWNSRGEIAGGLDLVIVLAMGVACTSLGQIGGGEHGYLSASVLFLSAAIAIMMGVGIGRRIAPKQQSSAFLLASVLFVVGIWLVSERFLWRRDVAWCGSLGVAAALLSIWVGSTTNGSSLKQLISAVIWLGVATVAFGLERGYGMAAAAISGFAILGFYGSKSLCASMGPLIGLIIYRSFREAFPDASRAFDIGQHYAMIGLLVAVVASMLPSELVSQWRARAFKSTGLFALVLGVALMVAAAGTITLLGAKGAVGWIVGCGIASVAAAFAGRSAYGVLAAGSGLACALGTLYSGLMKWIDLSRDQKVHAMIWCMVILAACVLILAPTVARKESQNAATT